MNAHAVYRRTRTRGITTAIAIATVHRKRSNTSLYIICFICSVLCCMWPWYVSFIVWILFGIVGQLVLACFFLLLLIFIFCGPGTSVWHNGRHSAARQHRTAHSVLVCAAWRGVAWPGVVFISLNSAYTLSALKIHYTATTTTTTKKDVNKCTGRKSDRTGPKLESNQIRSHIQLLYSAVAAWWWCLGCIYKCCTIIITIQRFYFTAHRIYLSIYLVSLVVHWLSYIYIVCTYMRANMLYISVHFVRISI